MHLKNSKTIVIKIGSSLLVESKKKIRKKWLKSFAKDIKTLKSKNKKIIIVSSGAIALGCKKLNIKNLNLKLDKSQAVASVGQIELMNLFSQTFLKFKLNISQILLTLDDDSQKSDNGIDKEVLVIFGTYSLVDILVSSVYELLPGLNICKANDNPPAVGTANAKHNDQFFIVKENTTTPRLELRCRKIFFSQDDDGNNLTNITIFAGLTHVDKDDCINEELFDWNK